ncbi:MAG: hypothetical protein ACP5O6_00510 [Candidatus Baltobacteraceae bacterium]
MLFVPRTARAATGTEFINAVRSFVSTGLANADSNFASLRGAPIQEPLGTHFHVTTAFGVFLSDCHISGYLPPSFPSGKWVLSCSSPGLSASNAGLLRSLVYTGVIRALPLCFTRTLNPLLLNGENFRWDCHHATHAISVDVSSFPTHDGYISFLLEVYNYLSAPPPPPASLGPSPAPSPTPIEINVVKPVPTLTMGGVQVAYTDYLTLVVAEQAALLKGKAGLVHAVEILKGGDEMPPYFPYWAYAGKTTQNGVPTVTTWVCGNLSPAEQQAAMTDGTLMGLLDSGLGGPALQKAYAAASAADTALGPNAADPFTNRRRLVLEIAKFFT